LSPILQLSRTASPLHSSLTTLPVLLYVFRASAIQVPPVWARSITSRCWRASHSATSDASASLHEHASVLDLGENLLSGVLHPTLFGNLTSLLK
ncbi:hypothetical protein ACJX0J_026909, partial [Zea mays]